MGPPPGGGKRGGLWDGDLASALQQLGPMWLWLVGRACLLVLALALLMLLHSVVPSASYLPLALVGVSTSGLVYVAVQQSRGRGLLYYLPAETQVLLRDVSLMELLTGNFTCTPRHAQRSRQQRDGVAPLPVPPPYWLLMLGLNEDERATLLRSLTPGQRRMLTRPGLMGLLPRGVQRLLLPEQGGQEEEAEGREAAVAEGRMIEQEEDDGTTTEEEEGEEEERPGRRAEEDEAAAGGGGAAELSRREREGQAPRDAARGAMVVGEGGGANPQTPDQAARRHPPPPPPAVVMPPPARGPPTRTTTTGSGGAQPRRVVVVEQARRVGGGGGGVVGGRAVPRLQVDTSSGGATDVTGYLLYRRAMRAWSEALQPMATGLLSPAPRRPASLTRNASMMQRLMAGEAGGLYAYAGAALAGSALAVQVAYFPACRRVLRTAGATVATLSTLGVLTASLAVAAYQASRGVETSTPRSRRRANRALLVSSPIVVLLLALAILRRRDELRAVFARVLKRMAGGGGPPGKPPLLR